MTADSWKSLIIKILLMILTPLAAQLHLSMGATDVAALAADLADILVLAYGVYRSSGMKLVPHSAVAIDPHTPQDAAAPVGANVAGKVVGVLLVAFLLSAFLVPPAFAQSPKLTGNLVKDIAAATGKPATAPAGSIDGAVQSFSDGVQKIEKALVDKGIADLTAAITDATNHNDNISLPCWQANLKLLQSLPSQWETPPSPIGIALGIQIQRDLLNSITGNDATSLKVACAALWGDQLKIVANLGALIGVRIATGGLF